MILNGTFIKWGDWPYFQISDQNCEFLLKISRKKHKDFMSIGILFGNIF
jgi:hypothetical protein